MHVEFAMARTLTTKSSPVTKRPKPLHSPTRTPRETFVQMGQLSMQIAKQDKP